MKPSASVLDRRVSIEYRLVEKDPDYGTDVVTWMRLGTGPMWAQVVDYEPTRTAEAVEGRVEMSRNRATFTFRYRRDVATLDSSIRLVLHGDEMDVVYQVIAGPNLVGRRQWIEMLGERFSS